MLKRLCLTAQWWAGLEAWPDQQVARNGVELEGVCVKLTEISVSYF